jgi:hypothetical protein
MNCVWEVGKKIINFPLHLLNSVAIIKNAIEGRRLAAGTLNFRAIAMKIY